MEKINDTTNARDFAWCARLLRATWGYVVIISLVELVIFALKKLSGTADNTLEYLLRYVLAPGAFNVSVMGCVHLLSNRLLAGYRFNAQAYVYVSGVSAICLALAWTHRAVMVSHAVFLLPVILSIVYGSKHNLRYAFCLNLATYSLVLLFTYLRDSAMMPHFMEICTGYALLLISRPICGMIVDRQRELQARMVEANLLSMTDSLTKLYNHATFYEQLDAHILRDADGKGGFSLIIFDIDGFKQINDRYGHDVGDEVLLALVESIQLPLGESDIAFRYGGEEFTVLTPHRPEDALALAEVIRADFEKRAAAIVSDAAVTVSAGVCAFDGNRFNGRREFFASADEALYEAKRTGKNRAVLWSARLLERPDAPAHPSGTKTRSTEEEA